MKNNTKICDRERREKRQTEREITDYRVHQKRGRWSHKKKKKKKKKSLCLSTSLKSFAFFGNHTDG
jgi:hypothetical protein